MKAPHVSLRGVCERRWSRDPPSQCASSTQLMVGVPLADKRQDPWQQTWQVGANDNNNNNKKNMDR